MHLFFALGACGSGGATKATCESLAPHCGKCAQDTDRQSCSTTVLEGDDRKCDLQYTLLELTCGFPTRTRQPDRGQDTSNPATVEACRQAFKRFDACIEETDFSGLIEVGCAKRVLTELQVVCIMNNACAQMSSCILPFL
ncbi:MAG: hypothetical protein H6707_13800 [Deltaproteobacteria bacterium]|nr:hypothetical protein [Deltaproteobacteria bacterium]